jgi:hypothetical protein
MVHTPQETVLYTFSGSLDKELRLKHSNASLEVWGSTSEVARLSREVLTVMPKWLIDSLVEDSCHKKEPSFLSSEACKERRSKCFDSGFCEEAEG